MPEVQQLPPQQEVVAKSYVVSPEAPDDGEVASREALARRLQRTFNESKDSDPFAALRQKREPGILERTDTESFLKKHLSPESEHLDQAKKTIDLVRDLEEKGYDGIEDAQQRESLKKTVVDKVIGGRDAFESLTPEEKDIMAESLLGNPETVGKIADTLKQRLEHPKTADPDVDNAVKEAKEKMDATQGEIDTNKKEIARAGREIGKAKRREGEINNRIDDLRETREDDKQEKDDLEVKLKAKYGEPATFDELQRNVEEKVTRGEELSGDELTMKDFIDVQKRLGEFKQLQDERANLPGKIDKLKDEQTNLRLKNKDLEHLKASQQGELDDALAQKTTQEEQFVTELEYSLVDGANEWLTEDATQRLEADIKRTTAEAKASADGDKKRLNESLIRRLYEVDEKRGHLKLKMKKSEIRKNANKLIQDGPEGLTRDLLMEPFQDAPEDSPEDKATKAQERMRIEQRLQAEPDFAKQTQEMVKKEVLGARMKTGPMYEGEIFMLRKQGWSEEAVQKVVDSNAEIRQSVDNVLGKTGSASPYERMRDNMGWTDKNSFFKSLAAIMSAIAVPTGVDGIMKWRMNRNQMGRQHPQG